MRNKAELAEVRGVAVDPAALRAVGTVLLDTATKVRRVNLDVEADTVPAARAFDGWLSGGALDGLVRFWQLEFTATFDRLGALGNGAFEAASNYTAADQAAHTELTSVDPQYFRGR